MYPGDPTTPGYPSYRNSTRTSPKNVPDIPSLPISWENACALLRTLTPGDPLQGKKIRLINNGRSTFLCYARICSHRTTAKTSVTPIWNVMAVIPGHIPSEVVVLGNHRDGKSSLTLTSPLSVTNPCSMGARCNRSKQRNRVSPRGHTWLWCPPC